tara:strand:- start:693 stop:941 length:249 start_codon:yes stop_codon:yes gene_type:complete
MIFENGLQSCARHMASFLLLAMIVSSWVFPFGFTMVTANLIGSKWKIVHIYFVHTKRCYQVLFLQIPIRKDIKNGVNFFSLF